MNRILASLALIVIVLPAMATDPLQHKATHGAPFATVAFAGHTSSSGYYCPCDPGPDGICSCCGTAFNNRLTADEPNENAVAKSAPSINVQPNSNSEPDSAALLLLVALFVWGTIAA